jgi:hypothetical protein
MSFHVNLLDLGLLKLPNRPSEQWLISEIKADDLPVPDACQRGGLRNSRSVTGGTFWFATLFA